MKKRKVGRPRLGKKPMTSTERSMRARRKLTKKAKQFDSIIDQLNVLASKLGAEKLFGWAGRVYAIIDSHVVR